MSVFDYDCPRQFLCATFEEKKRRNRAFSLMAWSRRMGFRNHTQLSLFLNAKRNIRPNHVHFLCNGLDLTVKERSFFRTLVEIGCAKSQEEKGNLHKELSRLHPKKAVPSLEIDHFHVISAWYHMAIVEMTVLADFIPDCRYIQQRLGKKVTLLQVKEALRRLTELGHILWEGDRLVKGQARLTTRGKIPSEAIRRHHKEVMALATGAIDRQGIPVRCYNSAALTIDKSKIPEAKELILEFRQKMSQLLEKKGGDETYQLSVQFFRLTE